MLIPVVYIINIKKVLIPVVYKMNIKKKGANTCCMLSLSVLSAAYFCPFAGFAVSVGVSTSVFLTAGRDPL